MENRLTGVLAAALLLAGAGTAWAAGENQQGEQQDPAQQGMKQEHAQQGGQTLKGTIASAKVNHIYVKSEEGAVVPFKVSGKTKYQAATKDTQDISSPGQLHEGDEVRVSFSRKGSDNLATKVELKPSTNQEISGKVQTAKNDMLVIEQNGLYVPLKVGKSTDFEGVNGEGKRVSSLDQIKAGDEVRASFRVRHDIDNEAQEIEVKSK